MPLCSWRKYEILNNNKTSLWCRHDWRVWKAQNMGAMCYFPLEKEGFAVFQIATCPDFTILSVLWCVILIDDCSSDVVTKCFDVSVHPLQIIVHFPPQISSDCDVNQHNLYSLFRRESGWYHKCNGICLSNVLSFYCGFIWRLACKNVKFFWKVLSFQWFIRRR